MPLNWLLNNVPAGWRAIVAISAIFAAGATLGAGASGLTKVPARVVALEARADSLTNQLNSIQRDVSELRRNNYIQLCMQIAEKRRTDWRECLK